MEDILKEMRRKINKDLILVETAEALKAIANISSLKAFNFFVNVEKILPNNISGYACGEMWYINYKNKRLFVYDKTRDYEGRGVKYNKYAKYGKIVISLDTQVSLQKFIDYIVKGENVYSSYLFENWIDKEQSIYKEYKKKKWRK